MLRCPKCQSGTFVLQEVFEEIEFREVVDGVVTRQALDHHPGTLLSTSCQCHCGHTWTPRRSSIESLDR